jgi:hypothetical protein
MSLKSVVLDELAARIDRVAIRMRRFVWDRGQAFC